MKEMKLLLLNATEESLYARGKRILTEGWKAAYGAIAIPR
jgi:hypothetical protein